MVLKFWAGMVMQCWRTRLKNWDIEAENIGINPNPNPIYQIAVDASIDGETRSYCFENERLVTERAFLCEKNKK